GSGAAGHGAWHSRGLEALWPARREALPAGARDHAAAVGRAADCLGRALTNARCLLSGVNGHGPKALKCRLVTQSARVLVHDGQTRFQTFDVCDEKNRSWPLRPPVDIG